MIITSEERSAGKALKPCSAMDAPERMFNPGKSFPGNRSMPAYPEDRTPAACPPRIVRNRMCSKRGNDEEKMAVQANYTEAQAAIREPKKIEFLPQADEIYRLDHAVDGTWKFILKAFAINPDHVKRKANRQSAQCRYTQLK